MDFSRTKKNTHMETNEEESERKRGREGEGEGGARVCAALCVFSLSAFPGSHARRSRIIITVDAACVLRQAALFNDDGEVRREVQRLLRAAVDAKDEYGYTPLHYAAESGSIDVARMLVVDYGANVEAWELDIIIIGFTPLHVAAHNGRLDVARMLVVEGHADVDAIDEEYRTPLHMAAIGHDLDMSPSSL